MEKAGKNRADRLQTEEDKDPNTVIWWGLRPLQGEGLPGDGAVEHPAGCWRNTRSGDCGLPQEVMAKPGCPMTLNLVVQGLSERLI